MDWIRSQQNNLLRMVILQCSWSSARIFGPTIISTYHKYMTVVYISCLKLFPLKRSKIIEMVHKNGHFHLWTGYFGSVYYSKS